MTSVLDASAMLAYLRCEAGRDAVAALFAADDDTCYAHALNMTEVFYDQRRAGGEDFAQMRLDALETLGVHTREDLDTGLWQDAGRIKADYARVSLADCCGLALARRLGAVFFTTDRHEMDRDEILALCPIRFIR